MLRLCGFLFENILSNVIKKNVHKLMMFKYLVEIAYL